MKMRLTLLSFLLIQSYEISYAKDVAFTLIGNSSDPLNGVEFANSTLKANYCLKQNGWDTQILTSSFGSKDTLNEEFKKNGMTTIDPTKMSSEFDNLDNQRNNISQVLAYQESTRKRYLEQIVKSLSALKPGDQFFLRINAHGSSCVPKDPSSGHCIAIKERNGSKMYEARLPTKEIAEAIRKNTPAGVKVAVDLQSCYSGLVVKDFADQGVCAYAYSTADAPQWICGGDGDNDPTTMSDLNNAYLCRNTENVPDSDLQKEESFDCFKEASSYLKSKTTFKSGRQSYTEVNDRLRSLDQTANQSHGTDGPFWIFDKLSDFGWASLDGNKTLTQAHCSEQTLSADAYIEQFATEIEKISATGQDKICSLKGDITKFLSQHKEALTQLIKNKNKINQSKDENKKELLKLLDLEKIMKAQMSKFNLTPEMMKGMEMNEEDLLGFARMELDQLSSVEKSSPEYQQKLGLIKSMLRDGTKSESSYNQLTQLVQKEASTITALQKEYNEYLNKTIIPIERELYNKIKSGPNYQACSQINPNWKKAKEDCESFKI